MWSRLLQACRSAPEALFTIAEGLTELHFAPDQTNLNIAKNLTEPADLRFLSSMPASSQTSQVALCCHTLGGRYDSFRGLLIAFAHSRL